MKAAVHCSDCDFTKSFERVLEAHTWRTKHNKFFGHNAILLDGETNTEEQRAKALVVALDRISA